MIPTILRHFVALAATLFVLVWLILVIGRARGEKAPWWHPFVWAVALALPPAAVATLLDALWTWALA